MKKLLFLAILLLFVSCNAVRVAHDYDKDVDFSAYSTYAYYPEMETGMSGLDNKRLFKAVDSVLRTKGYLLSEEPDFFVNIQTNSYIAPRNNTVGVGMGGTSGNVGGGVSIGLPIGGTGQERELIFDLVDSQKEELFWQGVATSAFRNNASPNEKESQFIKIAEKVFSKFPVSMKK